MYTLLYLLRLVLDFVRLKMTKSSSTELNMFKVSISTSFIIDSKS